MFYRKRLFWPRQYRQPCLIKWKLKKNIVRSLSGAIYKSQAKELDYLKAFLPYSVRVLLNNIFYSLCSQSGWKLLGKVFFKQWKHSVLTFFCNKCHYFLVHHLEHCLVYAVVQRNLGTLKQLRIIESQIDKCKPGMRSFMYKYSVLARDSDG